MKVVILAGGLGTRISEETGLKPKPMIEIGAKPILWQHLPVEGVEASCCRREPSLPPDVPGNGGRDRAR